MGIQFGAAQQPLAFGCGKCTGFVDALHTFNMQNKLPVGSKVKKELTALVETAIPPNGKQTIKEIEGSGGIPEQIAHHGHIASTVESGIENIYRGRTQGAQGGISPEQFKAIVEGQFPKDKWINRPTS